MPPHFFEGESAISSPSTATKKYGSDLVSDYGKQTFYEIVKKAESWSTITGRCPRKAEDRLWDAQQINPRSSAVRSPIRLDGPFRKACL
jgi:hypothetical protein